MCHWTWLIAGHQRGMPNQRVQSSNSIDQEVTQAWVGVPGGGEFRGSQIWSGLQHPVWLPKQTRAVGQHCLSTPLNAVTQAVPLPQQLDGHGSSQIGGFFLFFLRLRLASASAPRCARTSALTAAAGTIRMRRRREPMPN